MSKRPIAIATAQSHISADVRENGNEIRRLIRQARQEGAAIIHFPEGALSGYSKSQIKNWDHVDWDALDSERRLVADCARQLGLWVVFGCNHRLPPPHRPHNSLYVISAAGDLVARYDKQFCSHTEITRFYTPGRSYCVFEVEGWRFGCALCIEIQFAEVFLQYAALDVDVMLFSSYSEDAMFGIQAQGYAASHNYWFSISVPAQVSHALTSRMIGPTGETQLTATPSVSSIVINRLDADQPEWNIALQHARPWRKKAREGGIYRDLYVPDPLEHPSGIPTKIVKKVKARRGRLHAFETLEPAKTALVVIDLDLATVNRDETCRRLLSPEVVSAVNTLAAAVRDSGGVVAWVLSRMDVMPKHFAAILGPDLATKYFEDGHSDGGGTKLWPQLDAKDDDIRAWKSGASAFFPGKCDLKPQLDRLSIDTLLIAGAVTNICCESSARDAAELDYKVILVSDALSGHAHGLHEATLATFYRIFGDVRPSTEIIAMLST